MAGKINFLGHPVHPMVIVFPMGLLPAAVVCDFIYLIRSNPHWGHVAYWLVAGGVVSGIFAAICGIADWLGLENGTRAKYLGGWHARVNIVMLVLFAISWWLRRSAPDQPSVLAISLGVVALLFGLIGGWIGGEMVYRLSVGVDEGAHVNSPSSLSDRPASANKKG